ncbi:MAG: ABC transporter substrate-binding protein [Candidatus Dormiibacterota bacterium]
MIAALAVRHHALRLRLVLLAVAVFALSGCAFSGGSTGSLQVWTDAVRLPGFQKYEQEHPGANLQLVSVSQGGTAFQEQIGLFNKIDSGWPDVIWDSSTADISWEMSSKYAFAAPLNHGLIPKSVIKQFAPNVLNPCYQNGTLYCLRNDIAQNVLWYNQKLMAQFGYQVPTTWQQFEQLGLEVAKQHPGYVVGTAGDTYGDDIYYWGSRCPVTAQVGNDLNKVEVNLHDPNCTRMTSLLDALLAAGSLSADSALGPGFTKTYGSTDKVLMMVGPSWYGETLFDQSYHTPKGEMAAALPLRWQGESQTWTGDVGGGIYVISQHSDQKAAAASVIRFMAATTQYQATAPTYPAYQPAAAVWLKNANSSGYFAQDPATVFKESAGEIWPGWLYLRFPSDTIYANVVVPAIAQKKPISSVIDEWQSQLIAQSRANGYQVVTG